MTRDTRILCGVHLLGNAVLLLIAYYWLGLGESNTTRLLWSALVALLVLCFALWLHGTSLVYFEVNDLRGAGRTVLRHLPPMLLIAIVALIFYGILEWWAEYSGKPAFNIASYLTLHLRKPVKPSSVLRIFNVMLWLVRWMLLPALLLSLFATAANRGWSWRFRLRPINFVIVPLLLLAGLWLPLKLFGWIPQFDSFTLQTISFVLRTALAYGVFCASMLTLAWLSRPKKL